MLGRRWLARRTVGPRRSDSQEHLSRAEVKPSQPSDSNERPIEDEWLRDNLVAITQLAESLDRSSFELAMRDRTRRRESGRGTPHPFGDLADAAGGWARENPGEMRSVFVMSRNEAGETSGLRLGALD
jgi:hypothetical protein